MRPAAGIGMAFLAVALFAAGMPAAVAGNRDECVVLLHGLGRTARSMAKLEEALQQAGFTTANVDYPSRKSDLEVLAEQAVDEGVGRCRKQAARRIHFVTHSMGGILVRLHLSRHRLAELGRVVMLSPPNQGSEIADHLRDNGLYRWFNGPAGQQLGTGPAALPARLGPVDYPVGVITGDRPEIWDLWFSELIPGLDDGKVSVERAKVEGMRDFLVVHESHTFIMKSPKVIRQVLHFLEKGQFCQGGACAAPVAGR